MEPIGIDVSGEGTRIEEANAELREKLKTDISEGIGMFVFGRTEDKYGEPIEDDSCIPLIPIALGLDEADYANLSKAERLAAMQEGLFAELDITEDELPAMLVAEHPEEDGVVEKVYLIKDGMKTLHLVLEMDGLVEKRRLWVICPDEARVGFIDDSDFFDPDLQIIPE